MTMRWYCVALTKNQYSTKVFYQNKIRIESSETNNRNQTHIIGFPFDLDLNLNPKIMCKILKLNKYIKK